MWPRPPALQGRARWPSDDGAQHCRVETASGSCVEGELVAFEPGNASLRFRAHADGAAIVLAFSRIRSLTLTTPVLLEPASPRRAAPVWQPDEPGDCAFTVEWAVAGQGTLTGSSAGLVITPEGLYLFPSTDAFASVERCFIPRAAYQRFDVVPLDRPAAASNGIADLKGLLEALAAQETAPVLRIGESLIDLGLMNQAQLEQALADKPADVPLGELLVSKGVISRSDLMTGLAHKMGYPFVDLKHFPIDRAVAQMMSFASVSALRSLPIAVDAGRVIVVVDRPSSLAKLRSLPELAGYKVAIVIAPASRIDAAISQLPHSDPWALNVPLV